jgi:fructokinase
VLNDVLEHGIDNREETDLHRMLRFANMASWIVTTRKGAIRSMPERTEVETLL